MQLGQDVVERARRGVVGRLPLGEFGGVSRSEIGPIPAEYCHPLLAGGVHVLGEAVRVPVRSRRARKWWPGQTMLINSIGAAPITYRTKATAPRAPAWTAPRGLFADQYLLLAA